jgi:hypothetical protein
MSDTETALIPPFAIRAIYLRESHVRMGADFDPMIHGQQLIGKFRVVSGRIDCHEAAPTGSDQEPIRGCRFVTRFEFRYMRPLDGGEPPKEAEEEAHLIAEINADIAVDYIVGTPLFPPQEDLERWGATNVLLHSWPYWREYCQNTLARMNLPVTVIPLINIMQPDSK